MEKILLYTDNHFSRATSTLNKAGKEFSERLENQIKSLNWLENLAEERDCDSIICLGDFFDKATLNDEEISALSRINWANLKHYFLVGNHESTISDLRYSTTRALEGPNREVIDHVCKIETENEDLLFIPYFTPENLKSIKEYANSVNSLKNLIVLSHNDINNLEFISGIKSKSGFSIEDIEENCELFLNGHIHTQSKFCKNGYNIGNLTGKNFTEDSFKSSHIVYIVTIEKDKKPGIEIIENPYAYNFYTVNINEEKDIETIKKLKPNSVVRFNCNVELRATLENYLKNVENTVNTYIIKNIEAKSDLCETETLNINDEVKEKTYIEKFKDFCLDKNKEAGDIFKEELNELLKEGV